ncbi:MAG: hypothetical protein ACE5LU_27725, partial [Anaerolineae bacterium]
MRTVAVFELEETQGNLPRIKPFCRIKHKFGQRGTTFVENENPRLHLETGSCQTASTHRMNSTAVMGNVLKHVLSIFDKNERCVYSCLSR